MAADQQERVGVRELRQNLSVYLRRVQRGESLVVTERGRPVARLGPLPVAAGVLERLIEDGRATAATSSIDDLPPLVGPVTDEAGRALRDLREERL
jgi:prevent-host-death family protein